MVNVNSNLNFLLDHNNIDLKEVHKTIYGFDPTPVFTPRRDGRCLSGTL